MSYNPNIPLGTDAILVSQPQIKANYQVINNAFANNHNSAAGDATTAGLHTTLTLRPQSGDPTTAADQIALYNKLVSSIPELFFRPNSNQTPIQLTYPSIKTDSSATQYTFMAGPFIVYGGSVVNPTNGQTVTLTPGSNLLYVGLTTSNFSGTAGALNTAVPTSISGTSFNITFQTSFATLPATVYYLAIGV